MNKEELKAIVVEQSQTSFLPSKVVIREAAERLRELGNTSLVTVVAGLRRSGKSTLLHQHLRDREGPVYFLNFDDERLLSFGVDDFQPLNEIFYELHGTGGEYFFDEIQNVPGWERFVRRLHDGGQKVYITGSNATLMSSELGTRLTGRYVQLNLYPFSFREYLAYKDIGFSPAELYTTEGKAKIKRAFHLFRKEGGIPEYILTNERYYLSSLYDNIIYRDIIARHGIKREKAFKELVHFLISNAGNEFSYTSLRKLLGLSNADTVKEYIHRLACSYLLLTLNRYSFSLKKQMNAPKKVYAIDTAISHNVSFRFSENLGRQIENVVFIELVRRHEAIFYHHEKQECDFVTVERGEVCSAVQVTVSMERGTTRDREIGGLLDAMSAYSLDSGVIITLDEEEELEIGSKNIHVIPVWKWLLS